MTASVESQMRVLSVRIGNRSVGDGLPAYVIAEAGVNHNGSLNTALMLVDAAADAGADAVKFQMFIAADLVTSDAPTAAYQRAAGQPTTQAALLRGLELSAEDFAAISSRTHHRGIDFLATPFSVSDVDRLLRLTPVAVKLASTDLGNVPLHEVVAESGLGMIVSTGAATEQEIDAAVRRLDGWGAADRLILLHCVSSYPTRWDDANLRAIAALSCRFAVPAGYSDHTTSTETGSLAVAAGACVVEKHFTLDRRSPGPDHAMSLEPGDLGDYIQAIRRTEVALGSGRLGCIAAEDEVRALCRPSVVARRTIEAGTVLTGSMLTVKRPGGGIEPDAIERLIGRRTCVGLVSDQRLQWDMVE